MKTNEELLAIFNALYNEAKNNPERLRRVIVKAFYEGQKYQEEKIIEGINIVFESLHE